MFKLQSSPADQNISFTYLTKKVDKLGALKVILCTSVNAPFPSIFKQKNSPVYKLAVPKKYSFSLFSVMAKSIITSNPSKNPF
jgi:hypothetical protein